MAYFDLTANIDNFAGVGTVNDIFQGVGGGADTLRGNLGNDTFNIQYGQRGLLDGGGGTDRIQLLGHNNHTLRSDLTIVGVEQLVLGESSLYSSAVQLKSFIKFTPINASSEFNLYILGAGGALNFTTSYTSTKILDIDAQEATSKVVIIGSRGHDKMLGSEYADGLTGGEGNDTLDGFIGADILNGGLGKDRLQGDEGKDQFFFNTALGATNVDTIADFRDEDDTFRLDDAIFSALAPGKLAADYFKDLALGGQDANDVILYNSLKGVLYYDGDGRGGANPIAFAILENFAGDIPPVTFSDFVIV